MNENQSDAKYFSTSNFYSAVFLFIRGLKLSGIDWSNPQRAQFVFLDTPAREELIRKFNFSERNSPEVMVDAREFEATVKLLKDRLYQGGKSL